VFWEASGPEAVPHPGLSRRAREQGKRWGDPEGIVLNFAGEAEFNGVVFDNVLEEGLMVSPEQRARWKNVFFGENNLAEPDELYYDLKPATECSISQGEQT
jgi:hypothetical protein